MGIKGTRKCIGFEAVASRSQSAAYSDELEVLLSELESFINDSESIPYVKASLSQMLSYDFERNSEDMIELYG